jgi:hypothetical protein
MGFHYARDMSSTTDANSAGLEMILSQTFRWLMLHIWRPPQASDNWWSQRPHNNANSAHPVYTSQLYTVNPRTFFALEQFIRLALLVHCG